MVCWLQSVNRNKEKINASFDEKCQIFLIYPSPSLTHKVTKFWQTGTDIGRQPVLVGI